MTNATMETRLQHEVLAFVLENAPVEPSADIYSFGFEPDPERRYFAASAALTAQDETIYLVFTLASNASSVFLTITDGDPRRVAGALAQLEHYDAACAVLGHGDTVSFEGDAFLQENGRPAVLLLRPCVSHALPQFPDHHHFASRPIDFLLAVFLSAAEYQTKLLGGLDAVLSAFESHVKDLVALRAT